MKSLVLDLIYFIGATLFVTHRLVPWKRGFGMMLMFIARSNIRR